MADEKLRKHEIPLDGKLITAVDPSIIGHNYQTLTNLRYYGGRIKGVGGMTKINSSIIDATYFKVRSGIHFTKDQPSESHVLVEAFNTGLTASRILQNTTAVPSAGNFSATSLYTPSGSEAGRWAIAPDGDVAYCNDAESCIWGGVERKVSGFVNYDPAGTFQYDYTKQVTNTKTTDAAILNSTEGGIDANTMLLLSLNNNVTDTSPTTIHTVTNSNVTFTTSGAVFGTHRAVFTTDARLVIPDNADFDFSGGVFTIDAHVQLDDLAADYSIYYHTTDADNNFNLMITTTGRVLVRIYDTGAKAFAGATDFQTEAGVIDDDTDYHIQVVENGNDWYIFVNGNLQAHTSDAARAANYTGNVYIGYDPVTYLEGKIDEFRVSNNARNISNFEVPTSAYTTNTTATYFYIGSVRPLDGFKLYSGTANTSASVMQAYYWNGSAWVEVTSLVDGTSSGGISLAQTGSVTFSSTAAVAELKYISGVFLYWYKVYIPAASANTSIYYATVQAPFQTIKDVWSGSPTPVDSFQFYDNSTYAEGTLNVRENTYVSTDSGTYVSLDSMASGGTDYFVCGFSQRQSGVSISFVAGKENSTAGTVLTVKYWNGTAWVSVGALDDGTLETSVSMAKTGTVTWTSPAETSEFTQTISNTAELYYYKFQTSEALDAEVEVYYVSGIPTQRDVSAFKFPLFSNNRLFLCCDEKGAKNSVICSAEGSSSVFNGDDSIELFFGDDQEIMGGAWLYSQYGSSIFNVTLFFKKNETWALIGTGPEDWIKFRVSGTIGCVDPETIKVIDAPPQAAQALNRNVAVWRGANGIYMSDGRSPVKLTDDIDDIFNKRVSTVINKSVSSCATWDDYYNCYHFNYAAATATTLDKEMVLDFAKPGWFEIERTSTKKLQFGIEVKDTNGTNYNYGFIDTGYMLRLEYGTAFDGQDITHTFQFGDMAPADGSISTETQAEYFGLIAKAKTTTTSSIAITHYGDGNSTGTSWSEDADKSGYRLIYPVYHKSLGGHIFHSAKCVISTDDETYGFEPIYFYMLYKLIRDHLTDWRS